MIPVFLSDDAVGSATRRLMHSKLGDLQLQSCTMAVASRKFTN